MTESIDITLLRELLASNELADGERDAFEDMLARLHERQRALTPKQLAWAQRRHADLLLGDPAIRNATVPRGREVEMPASAKRPLRPPGRTRETFVGAVVHSFMHGGAIQSSRFGGTDGKGGTESDDDYWDEES